MQHHDLKAEPESFALLSLRTSQVQLRKNDRGYHVGDTCAFHEWDPKLKFFTGHSTCRVPIHTVLEKHEGLTEGWCLIVLELPATNITRFSGVLAGKSDFLPAVKI